MLACIKYGVTKPMPHAKYSFQGLLQTGIVFPQFGNEPHYVIPVEAITRLYLMCVCKTDGILFIVCSNQCYVALKSAQHYNRKAPNDNGMFSGASFAKLWHRPQRFGTIGRI